VKVSYSDAGKGLQGQATATKVASTAQPSAGKSQSSTSNNDSNSSDSNKQDQQEGAISGLSNLKRKLAEIDKERELYKIEQTKTEDEISTVTNSLSKLGDKMIQIRQDMTALSGNMRAELSEMKNILLGMNKKTSSPRRKTHRRTEESEAASSSSNDEKKATATEAGVPTPENDLTWDSMCKPCQPWKILISTGLTQGHESRWDYERRISGTHPYTTDAVHMVSCPEPPSPPPAQRV
jgi:hypothetical protein